MTVPRIKLCKGCNLSIIGPHAYCPRCAEEISWMQEQAVPGPDPTVPMLAFGAGVLFYALVLFLLIKWGMS